MLTCWKLLLQKFQRLLVVESNTQQLQRVWDDKSRKNSLVGIAGKVLQAGSFQYSSQNKVEGFDWTILQIFLVILSNNFQYQFFVAVVSNL